MNSIKHNPEEGWPKTNGMTVPDGYFEDFARRMMECIPDEPVRKPEIIKPSLWQRVRPYVYMAAMFAGIYLMLNIFTLTTGIRGPKSEASVNTMFAEVVNTGTQSYVDDYISVSDYDLFNELYESGYEIK